MRVSCEEHEHHNGASSAGANNSSSTARNTIIENPDILAIRSYITASDIVRYDAVHPDQILIDFTHSNLIQRHIEIRVNKHDTIQSLKQIIHQKTGTSIQHQRLQIYDVSNVLEIELPADSESVDRNGNSTCYNHYKIGYFNITFHGMRIHCIDTNPYSLSANGQLENTALVTKYRLTDEQYDAKTTNTVRAWARDQRKINPNFTYEKYCIEQKELMNATRLYKSGMPLPTGFQIDPDTGKVIRTMQQHTNEDEHSAIADINDDGDPTYGPESIGHITELNVRCQVEPGKRRGTVLWKGTIVQKSLRTKMPGFWVGVCFDEPVGKNDGSLNGTRYFSTPGDKYGCFVRGTNVEIGEFPVRDLFHEDENDDEDEL